MKPDPSWLQRLRARLDQPPARPRAPLELVAPGLVGACIGSIEPMLAGRIAGEGLPLFKSGANWCLQPTDGDSIDATLAAVAQWLRWNGLASRWRDERLAVTDAQGTIFGAIERAAVRPLGIATFAAHLVVRDVRGNVWVQQRAFDKATDPGLWDTTMGGLVAAGETTLQALERETWEEAGLRIEDLQHVARAGRVTVRRPLAEGYMVEHIDLFEALVPEGLVPVNQDGEVERFECVDRSTLISRLHDDAFTLEAGMILATWLSRQ